ncbi:hypothetical protein GAYE_SCF22MG4139 [Galdieria yellowstonensis]|uniref:Uncharacterized protein n=1 Tax=Galdieria yellowstonensis TaxID=3028027 RepID=A0AAV9IFJ7_9RHOD|nr:hypothetical protein GAYE_SCF22MG4139 [Galdieria yellowstonensis]
MSVGSKYVLDIASHFGFYHVKCSVEELCEANTWISSEAMVNLIFLRVAWRQIGKEYIAGILLFAFFPVCLNPLVVTSTCLRFRYVRWNICKRLGDLSTFLQSLLEGMPVESSESLGSLKDDLVIQLIPAFRTITNESHSGTENKSFFVHTWKTFYEQYLSEDGIYLPAVDGYEKPNILLRISDTRERCPYPLEEESSVAQGPVEMETNSQKTPTTYLIGISLYCSSKSSPMLSVEIVKEEVAGFVHALSSQLELEENHITAVLFIVSNECSPDISWQFTDNKNCVLDSSGIYRGSENVPLNNRLLFFRFSDRNRYRDSLKESVGSLFISKCKRVSRRHD